MCGLVGVAFRDSRIRVDITRALDAINYRGPDDRHVVDDGTTILGFVRLRILDLTLAGRQPMESPSGQVVLAFNGEIYNHVLLREELIAKGYTFRSRSDTEVILHGYDAWGEKVFSRIDGMFAIALWDRAIQRLFLVRDRVGKKPLFYAETDQGVYFGSEVKALHAAGLELLPDISALPLLFTFGRPRAPRSMFKNVRELPPATVRVFARGEPATERRYWRAPFHEQHPATDEEAIAGVRRLVEDAVRRRLQADVPVGAFLSGGIDSSIVVGVCASMLPRIQTFSIGFAGEPSFDETRFARMVAERFGTKHTEFIVEPSDMALVDRLVDVFDGPFVDHSAIPTSIVSGLTRKQVTVALSGEGGDELFCGYIRFLLAEIPERLTGAFRHLAGRLSRRLPGARETSRMGQLARGLRKSSLDMPDRLLAWHAPWALEPRSLFTPEAQSMFDVDSALEENRRILASCQGATVLSTVLAYNFETYLPDDLLAKADRSSMMHSLELRCPFLDTALVEYVARLPDSMKRRGATRKWVLRRAFADMLPDAVVNRKKMGFGMPLDTWFRKSLRKTLEERLAPGARIFRYIREDHVRRLLGDHMAGDTNHGHELWLMLTLSTWLEKLPEIH